MHVISQTFLGDGCRTCAPTEIFTELTRRCEAIGDELLSAVPKTRQLLSTRQARWRIAQKGGYDLKLWPGAS